jgi:hypothetical protein
LNSSIPVLKMMKKRREGFAIPPGAPTAKGEAGTYEFSQWLRANG